MEDVSRLLGDGDGVEIVTFQRGAAIEDLPSGIIGTVILGTKDAVLTLK